MNLNWLAIAGSTLVPLLVGAIWYNSKVFGVAWMNASGLTEEKLKGANMGKIFGLTLLFSFFLSFALLSIVIHQVHMYSILANETGLDDPNTEPGKWLADFNARFGGNFRTFKHGVFHGVLSSLLFVMPVFAINAMFERKGFKYIAINVGYWLVSLALMGGIICQWA